MNSTSSDHDVNPLPNHDASRVEDELSSQRWYIYWLLICCSVLTMVARLMTIEGESYGVSVPYFSANDRSRWSTIRSLGDHNTFALDTVLQAENGRNWDSIDKVMHLGRDGKPHFYSSKPTLLPWLLAYQYVGLKFLTNKSLSEDPFFVVRCMLLLSQIVPVTLFLVVMAKLADDLARSDWTKLIIVAAATYGTFLTTFSVTLTNHIPSTVSAALVIWALVMLWRHNQLNWGYFAVAGLFSAFAAANDLPAAALVAVAFCVCWLKSPIKTMMGFTPGVAVVVLAFFATNYIAHQNWTPAYAHREDGKPIVMVSGEFKEALDAGELPLQLQEAIIAHANELNAKLTQERIISRGTWPVSPDINRWLVENPDYTSRVIIVNKQSTDAYSIHKWNNWYEYPGSYWSAENPNKAQIDRGTSSISEYAFHFLIGHHGVFSLSPIWLWAVPGVFILCFAGEYRIRILGFGILAISIVVVLFYVTRPELDRAYGGMSSGPRWLFWLIPLWLVAMIPSLDRISHWGAMKVLTLIALFISAGSAAYSWSNPWVHPWIYQFFFQS